MEINPNTIPYASTYKLLTGSVVPRPIGWVSSLNAEGQPNLAPFSYFTVVCANPPTVLFCPGYRKADREPKDTLKNVRATGEFVLNIVTEDTADAMNISATELPADVNEFALANLTPTPSQKVAPPRVEESPIHFECKVTQIIDINEGPGGGSIVLGQVVHMHVREDLLIGSDKIDISKLKPIGRLAGGGYTRVTDLFEMSRLPSQIRPIS